MAFTNITARIVEILEINTATLVEGLGDQTVAIRGHRPSGEFVDQVIFIYRESLPELEYGHLSGTGASAHGEIDGVGAWTLSAYVRFLQTEERAAEELDKLAWNILRVLRGYYRDDKWPSLLITGSSTREETSPNHISEHFSLRVRWEMNF